jgi:hypothetical protein
LGVIETLYRIVNRSKLLGVRSLPFSVALFWFYRVVYLDRHLLFDMILYKRILYKVYINRNLHGLNSAKKAASGGSSKRLRRGGVKYVRW